jgi:hypothetical protein
MKDIEGKELKVGDKVISTYSHGSNSLYIYNVIRFTPKSVILEHIPTGKQWKHKRTCFSPETDIYKLG